MLNWYPFLFWFDYTDLQIKRFAFADNDVTFVQQHPKTFNVILNIEISTSATVTKAFETRFYLNNTSSVIFQQHFPSRQETFVPDDSNKAQLDLFRVDKSDELTVTVPKNVTCDTQYTYCVKVRDLENEEWVNSCLSNVEVSCDRPTIGKHLLKH